MRTCSGLLTIALVAAGCGSPLTVEEAFDEAIDITCDQAFECRASFPDGDTVFVQIFGPSAADCRARLYSLIDAQSAEVQASVDAGRIDYDAGDADECLDQTADRTCEEVWGTNDDTPESAACENAFRGTVADGGACTIDMDCAVDGSDCTDGVCGPF